MKGFFVVALLFVSLFAHGALAADPCIDTQFSSVLIGFDAAPDPDAPINGTLVLSGVCTPSPVEVEWSDPLVLELGPILTGEVVISENSVFVDSVLRPDLDKPATLVFRNLKFAVQPDVYKDGHLCDELLGNCTNKLWDQATRTFSFDVAGFSNYTLQGLQDFTVYSDPQPELRSRVYQTIDLGDGNRDREYKCVVQLYGQNEVGEFVLIQTNPQRNVPAKLLGNPDTNNPESLGYFKTENGLANVYFDGTVLAGYTDVEYVAMCADNSTKLVYEESLSTRYVPMGRSMVGRGVWLTSGSNLFFIVIAVVGGLLALWLFFAFFRTMRWR